MAELNPPRHEDFPIGAILRDRRKSFNWKPRDYVERLRSQAEILGYQKFRLFSKEDRGAYNNAERATRVPNERRLEVMCDVLRLPKNLFLRQNKMPVIGFAINYHVEAGSNVDLHYQPSVAIPLRNHSIVSSENAVSPHVIEALAFFLMLSTGTLTQLSRRNRFVATAVVLAAILLAEREAGSAIAGSEWSISEGDFITNASNLVADHCRINSGKKLVIKCKKERIREILERIVIYSPDERSLSSQPEGTAKIARRGPVTYWLVSDRTGVRGFVSLGEKNFLQCSEHDADLLKQRFSIAGENESGYSSVCPYEYLDDFLDESNNKLDIKFEI